MSLWSSTHDSKRIYSIDTDWYQGAADIVSFQPEELFGTKLRALLQRRKNRDLFDLNEGLKQLSMDPAKVVTSLNHYLSLENKTITRALAEQRMLERLTSSLTEDIAPLLPVGVQFNEEDAIQAFERVWREIIVHINGDGWKLTDQAVASLRRTRYPELLRNL